MLKSKLERVIMAPLLPLGPPPHSISKKSVKKYSFTNNFYLIEKNSFYYSIYLYIFTAWSSLNRSWLQYYLGTVTVCTYGTGNNFSSISHRKVLWSKVQLLYKYTRYDVVQCIIPGTIVFYNLRQIQSLQNCNTNI